MSGETEVVRVWLLGGFRVSVGDRAVSEGAWRQRRAAALVKLLALAPNHRLHREQVMEALWPNLGLRAASNNLRQAVHVARRTLHPDPEIASRYLILSGEQLTLCPEGQLWVDVEAFEEASATARRSKDPAAYRAAIELYAGELLPADRYEEWAEEHRRRLRETYLSLLLELARLCEEHADYDFGIEVLRRIVAEEPAREEAHVGLMRLYALSGSTAEALAQYGQLEEVLARELDTEPAASSRALREEIGAGRFPPQEAPSLGSPPEKSPSAGKHNLPAPRTSFVGRMRELIEIRRELAMTRLLTLTGMGGSGKTRLALEVARELVGAYPDGVWLVELAGLTDGELVPQQVAGALGVKEQPGQPLADTLAEALRAKGVLLVLDNCEHLADSVAYLVDTLLDSCSHLRVLTTSREPLEVEGELVWRVSSLSVPETDRPPAPGELTRYDAVRLFLDRARLRMPRFDLTSANTPAVADVCTKLEGIPLAIELATARMGTLSVSQIAEKLRDPLGLLSAGRRTAVPRHQTLRGTLDWSHDLLGDSERTLFGRLSVFAGGWTLEAAEAVAAGDGIEEDAVLDLLSRLVDKSLVTADTPREGGPRYTMLEPVRQYAHEKLEESSKGEAARRQHALFFLALAERAETELGRGRQGEWLERLERDHDNMRAALGWSFSREETEVGLRLAAALWEFWDTHGHLSEGRRWLERGISATGPTMTHIKARALIGAGWIALFQGDYEAAKALVEESLIMYQRFADDEGIASALANLGFVAVFAQRNLESVPALLEDAMRLRPKVKHRRTVAYLLIFEGLAMAGQLDAEGRFGLHNPSVAAQVRALHEQGLALFREIGDARGMDICMTNLGLLELIVGNHARATALLRENLHQARQLDDKLHIQFALFGLAGVAASQGQPVRATRLWAAAETVRETSGIQLHPLALTATDYEGHRARVRAELGTDAFERAWTEGRMMALEQAVEYAFSDEELASLTASAEPGDSSDSIRLALLTRREEEIAILVARGLTNRQIAKELVLSQRTVENHVSNILKKLGLNSRDQVTASMSDRQPHQPNLR